MESFLKNIYDCADTISELQHVVEYIRVHDDHHAVMKLNMLLPKIGDICNDCLKTDATYAKQIWGQVEAMKAVEKDLILLGDIIESGLLPLLKTWVQGLAQIEQEDGKRYRIESTECGFLTIWDSEIKRYLHSNNNPLEEARKVVEAYYQPEMEKYSIYGSGLGYHVYQLYMVSNGSVKITVFEEDPQLVEYAKKFGVLDWIPEENLKIVTNDSVFSFLNSVDNADTGIFLYQPSLYQIRNEVEREAMLQIYVQQSTIMKFSRDVRINFFRNISVNLLSVEEIDTRSLTKDMVVVAAGPSLDDTLELLKRWKGKKTILAVGTVFKKLLKAGISPDYVMISDPQKRTLKQIEGVENENIPMILDVTAYWEFARKYQGEKYLVYNTNGDKEIADYAREHHYKIWPGGGTVTALALEFAIQFGADSIYMVGVDLAYPDGISHASGTMDRTVKRVDGMQKIPGTMGKEVYADRVFITYREGIEKRIKMHPQITFYNMSKLGAHIEGAIEPGDERMPKE